MRRELQLTNEQATKQWQLGNLKEQIATAIAAAPMKAYRGLSTEHFAEGTTDTIKELWVNHVDGEFTRKELLTIAFQVLLPANNSYTVYDGAARAIGMRLLPVISYKGERITASAQMKIGNVLLDRMEFGGFIKIAKTKSGETVDGYTKKVYTAEVDWASIFGKQFLSNLHKAWAGTSRLPLAHFDKLPGYSRPKLPYLTKVLATSVSKANLKLSRRAIDALNHRFYTKLELFTFRDDKELFNKFIKQYCDLKDTQVVDSQREENLAAAKEGRTPLIMKPFDRAKFTKELNQVLLMGVYYIASNTDQRTRIYDASGFGFQDDKFIRHLIRFSEYKSETPRSRARTVEYIAHCKAEHKSLSKGNAKAKIEALGMLAKIAQLEQDLDEGTSNTPIEWDGNNSGVQMYATAALKSLNVGRYGGLDPQIMLDAYKFLISEINTLYKLDITVQLQRNDGKRPVMVFTYGAGKKSILLDGGDDWTGLQRLLEAAGVKVDTDTLWTQFEGIMDRMLPGVQQVMTHMLNNHASRRGTKLVDSKVIYKWDTLVGSEAQLRLEESMTISDIEMPMTNHRTPKGNCVTVSHTSIQLTPKAKTQALAPLPIHTVDASAVIIVLEYLGKLGIDVGTVHDGFFVRMIDEEHLITAYKLALCEVNNSNIYAEMMADLNPSVTPDTWDAEVANNIEVLKAIAESNPDYIRLTSEHIMNSTPLSW